MGASVSSTSLYRVVATVEIISSTVITVFGVQAFLLFQQMDDDFQEEKEYVQYSSVVAVAQSLLTILASVLLVGCNISSLRRDAKWKQAQQRPPRFGQPNSFHRRVLAPTWLAWTAISIASLLFVFIAPMDYCIQSDSDRRQLSTLTKKDGFYETPDHKLLGICHSFDKELLPIRNALCDLYSFAIISIIFKLLFTLMVYRNWKREMENRKKILIYIEGCDVNDDDDLESDPKAMCSSTSTTGVTGQEPGATNGSGACGEGEKKQQQQGERRASGKGLDECAAAAATDPEKK